MTSPPSTPDPAAPLILSVSGCRGIVGHSLTPQTICCLCAAVAAHVKDDRRTEHPLIVVARDGRQGGRTLSNLARATLVGSGIRVCDIGVAATPTLGVMVSHLGADAGLTITASHNPGQWNGLKIITAEGSAPPSSQARAFIDRYDRQDASFVAADAFGSQESDDTADHVHVARVLKALERIVPVEQIKQRRFRVVVDSVNASGVRGSRLLLDALGCDLIHLHADSSGIFLHAPEPTAENLTELCQATLHHNADIGFAQDPDADRLAIVGSSGRYLGEEYTLVLAARAVLDSAPSPRGATLCTNLSTSRMIDDLAEVHGSAVSRSPVGEANVVAHMRSCAAIIGGEGNGGVIWPPVGWIRDSLSAMALVLALMTRTEQGVDELASSAPSYTIEKRKLPCSAVPTDQAVTAIQTTYAARADATIDSQDGIRVDLPAPSGAGRAWLHVRPSNTEPIVRLIAEAPTAPDAAGLLDDAQRTIKGSSPRSPTLRPAE